MANDWILKRKVKKFIQHLGHDIEDEEAAAQCLEESLSLVGLVVMYFNTLEKSIDSIICEIISDRSDQQGLIILHGILYSAKVDLLKRLSDRFHSCFSEPPAYQGMVESLLQVGRLRNIVVHADWQNTDGEGFTFARIKISDKILQQEYVQISAVVLEEILGKIRDVNFQLSYYHQERRNLLSYGKFHID